MTLGLSLENSIQMKKILLIDPVEPNLNLTKRYLENFGYELTAVESAGMALDLLLDPKFDLIISEIDILGLDGFDLCMILKKYQIEIPLLFLTNRDDLGTRTEAKFSGASGLISKQTEYSTLPFRVREILHEKSFMAS